MGIFRGGVRVTRALTPSPSSTPSSDEEEPLVKKHRTIRKDPEETSPEGKSPMVVFSRFDGDFREEMFQVGESVCESLPEELFEISDIGDILSLESWNDCLSEEERQELSAYLPPDMDQDSFIRTLKELFGGKSFYFNSPLNNFWQNLKDGLYDPGVSTAKQTLLSAQRKEFYHGLRGYHNGMVNSLLEMRNLWSENPEAGLEERLYSWRSKSFSFAPPPSKLKILLSRRALAKSRRRSKGRKARRGDPSSDLNHFEHDNVGAVLSLQHGEKNLNPEPVDEDLVGNYEENIFLKEESTMVDDQSASVSKLEDGGVEMFTSKNKKRRSSMNSSGLVNEIGDGLQSKVKSLPLSKLNKKSQSKSDRINKEDGHGNMEANMYTNVQSTPSQEYDREPGVNELESSLQLKKSKNRSYSEMETFLSSPLGGSHCDELSSRVSKKSSFSLIPPSVASLPFSVLRFISAVRSALLATLEANSEECSPLGITFSEIVARVLVSPGDPNILGVQMPLDCLVRGVLKVLSVNGGKCSLEGVDPFVAYDKVTRCWSWIGPLPVGSIHYVDTDVQSYSDIWGIAPTTLYEMQDVFARWLKTSEGTLHQIWQLSLLPIPEYPVFPEEKERFKDLRAQKSLGTIISSTPEMRLLFHKEEAVRYSTAEITCCYTTADGRKSAVSPLKRLGGKSKAKARDHFMLKPDRPSHITILCLVRDAASRLPQGIGTRADVCTLLRDSQFIVEDVSELQLSHVVSGALDRLHYEKDPCVRYDSDKKLWVYLHADRNEEDFEEGGTASTRSSRRSKKDGADVACSPIQGHGYNNEEMSEPEHESGGSYNGSASPELLYSHQNGGPSMMNESGQARDEGLLPFIDLPPSMQPFCGNMQSHPMGWEVYKAGKELSISQ